MPRGRGGGRGRGRGRKKGPKPREARVELPKPVGVFVWAQCDNAGCQKWRKLPPGSVVNDKEPWFCFMNPNEDRNDCNISEESYNENAESAVYSLPGDDGAESRGAGPAWAPPPEHEPARREAVGLNGASHAAAGPSHQEAERPADPDWRAGEGAPGSAAQGRDGGGSSLPGARALGQVRQAHAGFRRLLASGGAWDDDGGGGGGGGGGAAGTPDWLWECLAAQCPEAAQLACEAADAASAAGYFQAPQAPGGCQQAQEAGSTARLALTAAAALAARETGRVLGGEDAQPPDLAGPPAGGAGPGSLGSAAPQQPALPAWSLQPGLVAGNGLAGLGQPQLGQQPLPPFSLPAGSFQLPASLSPGAALPQSLPGWQVPLFSQQLGASAGPQQLPAAPLPGPGLPNGAAYPQAPAYSQPTPQFWNAPLLGAAPASQLPGFFAGSPADGLSGASPGGVASEGPLA